MVQTGIFDLWYLLIEVVFGSIGAAYLAICIFFFIIGFMSRMSPMMILLIWFMFTAVLGIQLFGAFVAVIVFIISVIYFIFSLVGLINSYR